MECLVSHLWIWPVATEVSPHIEQEGVTAMPPSLTPARPSAQTHRWKLLRVIHPKLIASGALSYSGFHQKQALRKGPNCRLCIWGWSQRTLVEESESDTNGEEVSLHGAVRRVYTTDSWHWGALGNQPKTESDEKNKNNSAYFTIFFLLALICFFFPIYFYSLEANCFTIL